MMRIVIAGSSGFVGRSLVDELTRSGHEVLRLVRDPAAAGDATPSWNPADGALDPAVLDGADAVVNLCGRNIGERRWTPQIKQDLRSSRLEPTGLLAETLTNLEHPPRLLINASAVGYYGDRGDEVLDASSSMGEGFLAELVRDWEAAAGRARSDRTRVVLLRLGMVLGRGGALGKMLLPFKLGLGGPIGSGRQWWPWIAMDDVIGTVGLLLDHPDADGPIDLVSPSPTRCIGFARALGRVLGRPAVIPMPAAAARLMLGEMAEALLLASARVQPTALQRIGYEHRRPDLDDALRACLD
jgi:uncharacterized protein (TIGR01777 family)